METGISTAHRSTNDTAPRALRRRGRRSWSGNRHQHRAPQHRRHRATSSEKKRQAVECLAQGLAGTSICRHTQWLAPPPPCVGPGVAESVAESITPIHLRVVSHHWNGTRRPRDRQPRYQGKGPGGIATRKRIGTGGGRNRYVHDMIRL